MYIQQDATADNDSGGFDRTPRSRPKLYSVTMVGGLFRDQQKTSNDGMRIRVGSQVTFRNLILSGFGGEALDVRDNSPGFFMDGTSTVDNAIIHHNGGLMGASRSVAESQPPPDSRMSIRSWSMFGTKPASIPGP